MKQVEEIKREIYGPFISGDHIFDDRISAIGGASYLENFEQARPEDTYNVAPHYRTKQVVLVRFRTTDEPYTATVVGIHLYFGKVKYDLALWIGDGANDSMTETRIYNVDSAHVIAKLRE